MRHVRSRSTTVALRQTQNHGGLLTKQSPGSKDDQIRDRDQQRLRAMLARGGAILSSKNTRLILQYIQAQDTCRLLAVAAETKAAHPSAVLLRFGIDTLATGFWLAFVAPDEFFVGKGTAHIPSDISRIIPTLPSSPQQMLRKVLEQSINNDPSQTLLKDVLNPATHGDALVNVLRIGSAPASGFEWGTYIRDVMFALTHNFTVILRDEAGIDLDAEIARYTQP